VSKHARDEDVAATTTSSTSTRPTPYTERDGERTPYGGRPDAGATTRSEPVVEAGPTAHERFGGMNWGAAFFGWMVAVGMTVLLTGLIGAVVAALDQNTSITQDDAEQAAGSISLLAAIVLVVVLALAYYTGGYVAGRMSRFDGGRQGLGVWFVGLVVTAIAVAVGVAFGAQYDVLDRVDLPRLPIPTDQVTTGGVVTAVVVLAVTAVAAMVGGGVGRRYHAKVDRHLAA
jgi:cytochrome bd-type quinol oxidase subunit 2